MRVRVTDREYNIRLDDPRLPRFHLRLILRGRGASHRRRPEPLICCRRSRPAPRKPPVVLGYGFNFDQFAFPSLAVKSVADRCRERIHRDLLFHFDDCSAGIYFNISAVTVDHQLSFITDLAIFGLLRKAANLCSLNLSRDCFLNRGREVRPFGFFLLANNIAESNRVGTATRATTRKILMVFYPFGNQNRFNQRICPE
jgi:hypothetical protein